MREGRFTGAYPADWKALSARVRAEAGNRCVRCGHPSDKPGALVPCDDRCTHPANGKQRMLTVHHLDGDKANGAWWNLLALCQVCHLSVQSRVIPDRAWLFEHSRWFVPYVCGFYAARAGYVISRADADANPDAWLNMGQPWRVA